MEDAAVVPVPNTDMVLVKNLDVFTPIVDDPFVTGQIAACNVTNDLFAMNVPEISGMLVFLAIKTNTPQSIAEDILKGIKFFMEDKLGSKVVGGHTIYSEWPLIGGEASGFVQKDKIIPKQGVRIGDKLVLTKPIGLQGTMAAYRILKESPEILDAYSKTEVQKSIDFAIDLMITPNQNVVQTIHSYEDFSFIHAMSDVTGFGLAGHAKEMLQNSGLSAVIEVVPSIMLSKKLSEDLGYAINDCTCHETAGGMLMALDAQNVEEFTNRLTANGITNWIIGTIDNKESELVRMSDNVKYLEISNN